MRPIPPKTVKRANAQKRSDPVTSQEAQSFINALESALLTGSVCSKSRKHPELEQLRNALHDEFQPADPEQDTLFQQMVSALWGLRRVQHIETELYNFLITRDEEKMNREHAGVDLDKGLRRAALAFRDHSSLFMALSAHESYLFEKYSRNRKALLALQSEVAPHGRIY
jgi:hypothetical protein